MGYFTGAPYEDLVSQEDAAKAHKTVTKLTRMLCKTCKQLEKNQIEIPDGVKQWWKEHKKIDSK